MTTEPPHEEEALVDERQLRVQGPAPGCPRTAAQLEPHRDPEPAGDHGEGDRREDPRVVGEAHQVVRVEGEAHVVEGGDGVEAALPERLAEAPPVARATGGG